MRYLKPLMILLITVGCFASEAQQKGCLLVKDTLRLITLDIRDKIYPIIMNGVSKEDVLEKLKKDNVDSLLKSFYQVAYYIPAYPNGNHNMILACMGDSVGYAYIKNNQLKAAKLIGSIVHESTQQPFRLTSGELVFVSVVMIGGSFWRVDKNHSGMSTSSDEVNINDIRQIKDCYIPFEIDFVKKIDKKGTH